MKKLSMLLFGIVLMTPWVSASRYLSGDPGIETLIVKLEQELPGNFFTLRLANLQRKATAVSLIDARGKVLHKDLITKANGRQVKYILKDVVDGKYNLTIKWNNQSTVWELIKKGKQIEFKRIS